MRGQALLSQQNGQEAAAEFQKILDGRVLSWGPIYPFALVGVARGAAIAGDTARAKKSYEDFLALWKEAETDIPLLVDARKEYAALQAGQPVVLPPIVPPTTLPRTPPQGFVIAAPSGNTRPGITGTWWSETFPVVTLAFTADGAALTGRIDGPQPAPLYDGTIRDGVITFKVKSPGGQHVISFTGKDNGGELVFSRDVEVLSAGGPPITIFGLNAPKTFIAKRVEAQPAR
jgi:hypothetical protein